MGRAGGSYEQPKKGKKKLLEQTKGADPVDGTSTRLEEQAAGKSYAGEEKGKE